MLWSCAEPERLEKSKRVMQALAMGWGEHARLIEGRPPDDGQPFACWGQIYQTLDIVPPAVKSGRPFWHVDNGYWRSVGNTPHGYHRVCYRGMTPLFMPGDRPRFWIKMKPWRTTGSHVLLALPTGNFGRAVGISYDHWFKTIEQRIRQYTDRPVRVRAKDVSTPIEADLVDCWALVTHSSNAAVDAVLAGIPAFVEPTAPTAMLGNIGGVGLISIEKPALIDRDDWWTSLSYQQFTQTELSDGTAWPYLREIRRIVDDARTVHDSNRQVGQGNA